MDDRRPDRLAALAEAFRAFAEATTDYRSLLDTVASEATRLVSDGCVVMLVGEDGAWLDPGAAHARDPESAAILRATLARLSNDASDGLAVRVVQTGETVLIPEIEPDALASRAQPVFAEAVRSLGIRSFLSVPLEVRGRRLGALALYRFIAGSPPFDDDDLLFARSISDHAALAISNAQLFESLQRELVERKRAEEQAKTAVALINNSTDMIAMANFDGSIVFVNAAGRALVGIAADRDVATMSLADFHTDDGMSRASIIREKGSWQGEGVLKHFDTGELIPVQVSSFIVRDADGKPLCFATVQHDMRTTKRLEAQLRQAQKMEALGRLAGGISHDFNNLLTVILSYCYLLSKKAIADRRIVSDVQQIERAGMRAADLTKQLLAFSRQQVLAPKALDLGDTVRAMEGMIRPLVGEDIELCLDLGEGLGDVTVDAGQIEQVIVNLVVNARDAMHERGGTLTLATREIVLDETAGVELGIAPGRYYTLEVADTGAGMDDVTRSHLFEPFFTTKDRGKGTGLGLSTVSGIVRQSGGLVTVDTVLGRGTTFRVYLPSKPKRAGVEEAPAPLATIADAPGPVGIVRILVAEDEREVRLLVRDVLSQAGYEVIDADDGAQALEVCRAIHGEIHLLLTDVIMPKMSGRELATRFREMRPTTRVLYMSGYTDDKLGHHGVLDPDVELIQKPLTPEMLIKRVREVLS